jgi:hypothetical protein
VFKINSAAAAVELAAVVSSVAAMLAPAAVAVVQVFLLGASLAELSWIPEALLYSLLACLKSPRTDEY